MGIIFSSTLLAKAALLALNLLQTHTLYICTYIPWPCDQTGKDCIQPKNCSGKEAGEKLCVNRHESAAASRKAADDTSFFFFFLGDVVLKEEPPRDVWLERPRWVWGGKLFYFGKILLPLANRSLQKDFVHYEDLPLLRQPLSGSHTKGTIKMPPSQLLP